MNRPVALPNEFGQRTCVKIIWIIFWGMKEWKIIVWWMKAEICRLYICYILTEKYILIIQDTCRIVPKLSMATNVLYVLLLFLFTKLSIDLAIGNSFCTSCRKLTTTYFFHDLAVSQHQFLDVTKHKAAILKNGRSIIYTKK